MKADIWENLSQFVEDSVSGAAIPGAYWYPVEILSMDVPIVAYDIRKLFDSQLALLETVMRECGIEYVTEVDLEDGPEGVFEGQNIFALLRDRREYEVWDLRFWRPRRREAYYTFPSHSETYYFDESKTWMIYVSHEGTLTFAGAALVNAAQRIIPDEYLFRGWGR